MPIPAEGILILLAGQHLAVRAVSRAFGAVSIASRTVLIARGAVPIASGAVPIVLRAVLIAFGAVAIVSRAVPDKAPGCSDSVRGSSDSAPDCFDHAWGCGDSARGCGDKAAGCSDKTADRAEFTADCAYAVKASRRRRQKQVCFLQREDTKNKPRTQRRPHPTSFPWFNSCRIRAHRPDALSALRDLRGPSRRRVKTPIPYLRPSTPSAVNQD